MKNSVLLASLLLAASAWAQAPQGEIKGDAVVHTAASAQDVIAGAQVALPASVTGGAPYLGPLRGAPKEARQRVPVVVFMHGSSGLALKAIGEWQQWLAGMGIASLAPDSFALPNRLTYKSPVDKATYEKVHALRLATALTEDYATGYSVIYYLTYMLRWDMLLVLLPAVYGLLRAAAVRWSGQGCLLNRPYLQVTGILWLISLAVEIVRWIVTLPPMQAFAATVFPSYFKSYQALWDKFAATLPFLYVPRITAAVVLTVLAVTALAVRRKNGAGAAQSKDEAA